MEVALLTRKNVSHYVQLVLVRQEQHVLQVTTEKFVLAIIHYKETVTFLVQNVRQFSFPYKIIKIEKLDE